MNGSQTQFAYSDKMSVEEFKNFISFQNDLFIAQKASNYRLVINEANFESLPDTETNSLENNILKEESGEYTISVYDAFITNKIPKEIISKAEEIRKLEKEKMEKKHPVCIKTPNTTKVTMKRPFLSSGNIKKTKVQNPFRSELFKKKLNFDEKFDKEYSDECGRKHTYC